MQTPQATLTLTLPVSEITVRGYKVSDLARETSVTYTVLDNSVTFTGTLDQLHTVADMLAFGDPDETEAWLSEVR